MNKPLAVSRRRFATAAIATLGCTATMTTWGRFGFRTIEVIDKKVISPQSEYYHGWPTLAGLRNGNLVVTFSGRRQGHLCPFGSVEMMISRDAGDTWAFPRTVHESGIDDRDAGVLETARGTIFVTSFSSLAYTTAMERSGNAKNQRWLAAHRRLPDDAARNEQLGCWGFRSTDGGATFSQRIPTQVNSPHGPCQLRDGRLLYLGKELWSTPRRIGAAQSLDDGLSWQWLSEIPTRGGDSFEEYHELHCVECLSGLLITHIRNHNQRDHREILQTVSYDSGHTWIVPEPIGVRGFPSHLLLLRDGRILMTYGHRRFPFGVQARISQDEGRSYSEPLIISADGTNGDLGYPSTVELPDGSLITVWYEKMAKNPRAQLRQARWRLR